MRYSERELSLQRGKTTVFDCHEIRLRVTVSSLAIRFGSLSCDDMVQAVQNTIDSCINSATDRHGHLAHLYRTPNPYPSLALGGVCRSATAALLMYAVVKLLKSRWWNCTSLPFPSPPLPLSSTSLPFPSPYMMYVSLGAYTTVFCLS